jgi:hypothetical protein
VKPTEVPKVLKNIKGNLTILTKAPAEVAALITSVDNLKSSITSAFPAGAADAPPPPPEPTP